MTHLQHTRTKNIWFVGILDEKLDDFNRKVFQPQIDGAKSRPSAVPTGTGKTIILSAVTGKKLDGGAGKACVLAHRDELTSQNRDKFTRVNPGMTTSVVDANSKDWQGQVTFAMAPTLSRPANLEEMPLLDLLVIDERGQHRPLQSMARFQ